MKSQCLKWVPSVFQLVVYKGVSTLWSACCVRKPWVLKRALSLFQCCRKKHNSVAEWGNIMMTELMAHWWKFVHWCYSVATFPGKMSQVVHSWHVLHHPSVVGPLQGQETMQDTHSSPHLCVEQCTVLFFVSDSIASKCCFDWTNTEKIDDDKSSARNVWWAKLFGSPPKAHGYLYIYIYI